ncbi:MAG: heavy metal-binding domain-containing protein [Acidimicrobiia bacterium]
MPTPATCWHSWELATSKIDRGVELVIGIRFATSMVMQNAAEVLAYGTGVVVE